MSTNDCAGPEKFHPGQICRKKSARHRRRAQVKERRNAETGMHGRFDSHMPTSWPMGKLALIDTEPRTGACAESSGAPEMGESAVSRCDGIAQEAGKFSVGNFLGTRPS